MYYMIAAVIALLLIIEGFLPFVAPRAWRVMVVTMAEQSDRSLRVTGFVLIVLGLTTLILAHRYL